MNKELHILILEDVPADAELIALELRKGGIVFSSRRVETKEDFQKELRDFMPDIILADFSLPAFSGLSALLIVKKESPDVPLILVSGAIGEELAVKMLKEGATDYVLKSRLSHLVPSIMRALREVEERRERKQAEEALHESEERYRTIFENTGTATVIIEEDTTISLANTEFENLSGYSKEEIEDKKTWADFVVKDDIERMKEYHRLRRISPDSAPKNYEFRFIDRAGNIKDIFLTAAMIPGTKKSVASLLDITERKKAEEKTLRSEEELKKRVKELEEFYNMAVTRELKMIELKKEIEGLKEELLKYKKE